jgi:hypothetical protein
MPCEACGSVNQKKYCAEMGIHFLGLKGINKPVVWVFPEVVVCLDCGMTEFFVPKRGTAPTPTKRLRCCTVT